VPFDCLSSARYHGRFGNFVCSSKLQRKGAEKSVKYIRFERSIYIYRKPSREFGSADCKSVLAGKYWKGLGFLGDVILNSGSARLPCS
jgi:hypothetical protein